MPAEIDEREALPEVNPQEKSEPAPDDAHDTAAEAETDDDPHKRPAAQVHVAQASGQYEWYTPENIIAAAAEVMGGIDLDPASSAAANQIVKATRYLTEEDDALNPDTLWMPEEGDWQGRVFLNPPYKTALIETFATRLLAEIEQGTVTQAIWLSNNATETKWAKLLLSRSRIVCFPTGRISFLNADLQPVNSPLQGQMIIGIGEDIDTDRFWQAMSCLGPILY